MIENPKQILEALIETDIKALEAAIARQVNDFEKNAIIEKAIKAVCSTMTRKEGRAFLRSMGAKQS